MRFEVKGANRSNGQAILMVVEGANVAQAKRVAVSQGVEVEGVRVLSPEGRSLPPVGAPLGIRKGPAATTVTFRRAGGVDGGVPMKGRGQELGQLRPAPRKATAGSDEGLGLSKAMLSEVSVFQEGAKVALAPVRPAKSSLLHAVSAFEIGEHGVAFEPLPRRDMPKRRWPLMMVLGVLGLVVAAVGIWQQWW